MNENMIVIRAFKATKNEKTAIDRKVNSDSCELTRSSCVIADWSNCLFFFGPPTIP